MTSIGRRLLIFGAAYAGSVAALWAFAEAYTYFTGDRLRQTLGGLWIVVFYVVPCLPAALAALRRQKDGLSREELDAFTRDAVDPTPLGPIQRPYHNTGLSDRELRETIRARNAKGEPTYLLRMEYERRLGQRSRQ